MHGAYHQLDTPGTVLVGGASMGDILVQDLTRGYFEGGFQVTTMCYVVTLHCSDARRRLLAPSPC